jgi:agmatinase
MESMIQTSACISFTQRGSCHEVVHRLNGRRYLVTQEVKSILDTCRKPAVRGEFVSKWKSDYGTDTVENMISYLLDKNLLVESDADETYCITAVNNRLYGFPQYLPGDGLPGQVVFCGIPFGMGNSSDEQCKRFPLQIRQYLAELQIQLKPGDARKEFNFISSQDSFDTLAQGLQAERYADWGDLYINRYEQRERIYQKMQTAVAGLFSGGQIPFILGGDHSITYPLLQAAAMHHRQFQVLQFDAHTDTYQSEQERLYGMHITHHHGNFMRKALELEQIVAVHQFGIRGIFNHAARSNGRQHIYWADQLAAIAAGEQATAMNDNLPVYLTFDIDFFDPLLAPGTATPVINGPDFNTLASLLQKLLAHKTIIGVDLVEINPTRDTEQKTMQLAALLIPLILNYIN